MSIRIYPDVDEGYSLLHHGACELSRIESNGIRIDLKYLDQAIEITDAKIKRLKFKLRNHRIGKIWQKRFGLNMNLSAREQLGVVLFSKVSKGGLGYKPRAYTDSGLPSTDESDLMSLNLLFVTKYLLLEKYEKSRSTYLLGIKRQTDARSLLHAIFNLHTVLTYRSSSDSPNFQNMPTRNPIFGKLIRRAFIAREGCVLVENDFKGIEVGVAACYHKDPTMLTYIKDETKDMHRDMAFQIYRLNKKLWAMMKERKQEKMVRHTAKNKFVFPQFYGDWWIACAKYLWEDMELLNFQMGDISMKEHLAKMGITELGNTEPDSEGKYEEPAEGTFCRHIKEVEADFWNERFPVYTKWKKKWFAKYLERGYFDTYTGFRIAGSFKKNQVINFPVQGSAFHCLLWSLIEIQRELRKRKMKTKVVGQIHDSILADVPVEELDEYLAICREVTTVRLRKKYPWIIVPLVIECEICPQNMTWFDKREVKMKDDGSVIAGDFTGTAKGLIQHWNTEQKKAA